MSSPLAPIHASPLAESMAHNHRPPATRMTSYTGLPLMYARGRRAGAIHNRAMDGKATTALPARAQAAAGAHSRRVDRVLVRASPDVAVRVWGGHVRAGARRGVQFVERAGRGCGDSGAIHADADGDVRKHGDSELRLVPALRQAARERGGPLPSIDVADALLDERRELTEWATTRNGNFHNSRCD